MNPLRISLVAALGLMLSASAAFAAETSSSAPAKERALVPSKRVLPAYPAKLGTQFGRAEVLVEVDPSGKVVSARVLSASADEFGAEALVAAKAWQFKPVAKGDQAVHAWARLPFKFEPGMVAMW